MIGKSLALFCVVFGIAAGSYVQVPQCGSVQYQSPVISSQVLGSPVVSAQIISSPVAEAVSSPVVQISGDLLRNNAYENNVVNGVVGTDGPETAPLPVLQAPAVTLPTVESPLVALPSQPIPAPRVISQRCICTKTVVKPQVIQRQVTVPKVQRYLKRTVTPIVENVSYKSRPISASQSSFGSSSSSVVANVASAVVSNGVSYNQGNCYSRLC